MEVNRLYLKRLIRHLEIRVLAHLLLVFVICFSHRLHYLLQIRLFLCESVKVVHDLSQFFILKIKLQGMLVNPKASTMCSFPESVTLWLRYFNFNLYNAEYEERNAA